MPTYTADPTGDDLQALLTAAKLWDDSYADLAGPYVEATVERFEALTGRRPFLRASDQTPESTIFFDPPGDTSNALQYPWKGGEKRLELDVPFTSISAIYTGCVGQSTTPGTACVIGQNVFLKPDRYDVKGLPIEWLEFTFPVWGGSLSVGITGTPGSYASWPLRAWNGVLAGAAASLGADVLSGAIGGGVNNWKEGDVSESYGDSGALKGNVEMWKARFDETVRAFRLIRVGL